MPISSYEDMKEKRGKIVHSLIEAAEVVDELNDIGLNIDGSKLVGWKNKLEDDDFKVLVIGEFKNGKSTFINSMMGSKVLPAYSTPCTAVINEVKYGERVLLCTLRTHYPMRYLLIFPLRQSNILKSMQVKLFRQ